MSYNEIQILSELGWFFQPEVLIYVEVIYENVSPASQSGLGMEEPDPEGRERLAEPRGDFRQSPSETSAGSGQRDPAVSIGHTRGWCPQKTGPHPSRLFEKGVIRLSESSRTLYVWLSSFKEPQVVAAGSLSTAAADVHKSGKGLLVGSTEGNLALRLLDQSFLSRKR